jgi:hypothetical protein
VTKSLKFPPRLWSEFTELVPEGERSALIHQVLERELRMLREQAVESPTETEPVPTAVAPEWEERFGQLLEKAQRNAAASGLSAEELEREVTLAREEARELRRARRS